MLHYGLTHSVIQPFSNNCLIFSRIILDSYVPYDALLQHEGFVSTVSIEN